MAVSAYFESMFEERHFAESKSREVELKSLTSTGLEIVMDMIYTGECGDHLLYFIIILSAHIPQNDTCAFRVRSESRQCYTNKTF